MRLMIDRKNSIMDNDFIIAARIINLLTELILVKANDQTKKIPALLLKIRTYLEMNYQQELSLQQLSTEFSVSKSYIEKGFKKSFAQTPIQYLNHVRINKSKFLLRNTELSIEEITELIGINDSSYFIQLFKKRIHTTPGKYRKSWN